MLQASESSDSNATNCHSELEQQPELISAVTIEVEVTPTEEKGENNGDLVNVVINFFTFKALVIFLQFLSSSHNSSSLQVSAAQDVCEDVAGTVSLQENGRFVSTEDCYYKVELYVYLTSFSFCFAFLCADLSVFGQNGMFFCEYGTGQ